MSDTIFSVEHRPGEEVVLRFKPPAFQGLPDATWEHLATARDEVLLALRSMLDSAIERTEKPKRPKGRKKTKIEVQ